MKTNKLVWKIVSVVLALAMVVTLLPTNGLFTSSVEAATVLYETSFEGTDDDTATILTTAAKPTATGEWNASTANNISLSTDETYANTGSNSLLVTNTKSTTTMGTTIDFCTVFTDLVKDTQYTVSCSLYSDFGGTTNSAVKVQGYTGTTYNAKKGTDGTQITPVDGERITYEYTFTATATTMYVGYYVVKVWKSAKLYFDDIKITYSDTSNQTWVDYIVPVEVDDADYTVFDSSIDTTAYTTCSVGSFENYSDWNFETTSSTCTSTAVLNVNEKEEVFYTNHSGVNSYHWYDSSSGNRMYATTAIGAMAAGTYKTNIKAVGTGTKLYLVADFGDDVDVSDKFEMTDEGYAILATLKDSVVSTAQSMPWVDVKKDIQFDLYADYTNVQLGIMAVSTSAGAWGWADDFFLVGPDNSDIVVPAIVHDDDISNGDFSTGSLKGWYTECDMGNDTSGNYYYGFTIESKTARSGSSSQMFTFYNSSANGSEVTWYYTMYQYVKLSEAGNYYIGLDSLGAWADDAISVLVMGFDKENQTYDEENILLESNVKSTEGNWNKWNAFATDIFTTTEDDQIVCVYITMAIDPTNDWSSQSSAGQLDDIHIYAEGQSMPEYTYHGTDQFADGGFDNWGFTDYWTLTADNDEDTYLHGYSFPAKNTDETAGTYTDPYFCAFNNSTTDTYSYSFGQTIDFTKSATYSIQADMQGYLGDGDGSMEVVVTNKDGDVVLTTTMAPESNDEFTACLSEDYISVVAGQTLTFTFNVTLGVDYTDDDGYECQAHLNFDNPKLVAYIPRDVASGDLGYSGNSYVTDDGEAKLVNGGTWISGVDLSSLITEEEAGVTFADKDGNEADVMDVLADAGVNYVRIRIWNNPYTTDGATYGGGENDVAVAAKLAERAANAGLSVYLDFQLSDFWADPSYQIAPKDWADYTISEKCNATTEFITESLKTIAATGVNIGIVSIGNETNNTAIAGETDTLKTVQIMDAGADAVKAFDSSILVALHFAPTGGGYISWICPTIADVSYDILAVSAYAWNTSNTEDGDLSNLFDELNTVANTYGKLTMVAEYDWPWTLTDQDGYSDGQDSSSTDYRIWSNDSDSTYRDENGYEISVEGQYNVACDMITRLSQEVTSCIGAFYWEPTWVGVGTKSTATANSKLWATYGCGTATAAGASYLKWSSYTAGGTVQEIKAMFSTEETGTASSPLSFTDDEDNTVYSIDAFGLQGEDGNMPIAVNVAQISSPSNGYVAFRLVGQVNRENLDSVGFRVFTYDEDGNLLGSSYFDKTTTKLYSAIKADGVTSTPDEGYDYFYAYTITKIPADKVYYFKIMANAKDIENISYFQRAAKCYAINNGELISIEPDEIGTLTTITDDDDDSFGGLV